MFNTPTQPTFHITADIYKQRLEMKVEAIREMLEETPSSFFKDLLDAYEVMITGIRADGYDLTEQQIHNLFSRPQPMVGMKFDLPTAKEFS